MAVQRLAILTTHYGDPFWVELLLRRIRVVFPELEASDVYVIDQDRGATSTADLHAAFGDVRLLRYPRSEPHFAMTGHDHAHVLNLAVREIDAEVLLVLDSDAHPAAPAARDRLFELLFSHDAVLAGLGPGGTETHPCFMAFGPAVDRTKLFFDAHQLDDAVDTGREIHRQVTGMGLDAAIVRPEAAFRGFWGTWYLDRTIYHHGSGSFGSSTDVRLLRQYATWERDERRYRRRVARGVYDLDPATAAVHRARRHADATAARFTGALRRRLGRDGASTTGKA